MKTDHKAHTRPTTSCERPKIPRLTADDFVKAKYSQGDKRCFTARMLDVFLEEGNEYVPAYKEFRLAVMDYLYEHHRDDHAKTAEQRAACWNIVGESLGYEFLDASE